MSYYNKSEEVLSEVRQVKGGRKNEKAPNSRIGSDCYFSGRKNSLGPCTFPFLRFLSVSASGSGARPCLLLPGVLSTLSPLWLSGLGLRPLGLEMDRPWLEKGLDPRLLAL